MPSLRRPGLKLDDQICFALYAATNAIVRAYRPLLGELGLTHPQYLVMLALWQHGTLAGVDLARRLQLGASAMTPLIDRLETAGFVTRARTSDRRVVLIALTDAGRALEDAAAKAQQVVAHQTGLGDMELASLRKELRTLAARISRPETSSMPDRV